MVYMTLKYTIMSSSQESLRSSPDSTDIAVAEEHGHDHALARGAYPSKEWSSEKMSLWLSMLARRFREQSALLLQQADLMERTALANERGNEYNPELLPSSSRDNLEDRLRRKNIIATASATSLVMMDTHKQLDAIERRLHPWNSTNLKKIRQERHSRTSPSKYSRRGMIGSPFTLYLSQNYTDFAKAAGSRSGPAVMKEASKAWNELSLSEKHPYIEIRKAERMQRKQEQQEQQEQHAEIERNEQDSTNNENGKQD